VTLWLYFGRPEEGHQRRDRSCCEQRLPWCWTEEAAPWISQQLGLLVLHIAGTVLVIALCWCWQCLLTVGGNWLPYIITALNITTVLWCCRQTQDVLHPAECQQQHCKHYSDSGQKCLYWLIQQRKLQQPVCWSLLLTVVSDIVIGQLERYNRQVCHMIICIFWDKLKSVLVSAAYQSGSEWMCLKYFNY
jgi:hypothetical protein